MPLARVQFPISKSFFIRSVRKYFDFNYYVQTSWVILRVFYAKIYIFTATHFMVGLIFHGFLGFIILSTQKKL